MNYLGEGENEEEHNEKAGKDEKKSDRLTDAVTIIHLKTQTKINSKIELREHRSSFSSSESDPKISFAGSKLYSSEELGDGSTKKDICEAINEKEESCPSDDHCESLKDDNGDAFNEDDCGSLRKEIADVHDENDCDSSENLNNEVEGIHESLTENKCGSHAVHGSDSLDDVTVDVSNENDCDSSTGRKVDNPSKDSCESIEDREGDYIYNDRCDGLDAEEADVRSQKSETVKASGSLSSECECDSFNADDPFGFEAEREQETLLEAFRFLEDDFSPNW